MLLLFAKRVREREHKHGRGGKKKEEEEDSVRGFRSSGSFLSLFLFFRKERKRRERKECALFLPRVFWSDKKANEEVILTCEKLSRLMRKRRKKNLSFVSSQ